MIFPTCDSHTHAEEECALGLYRPEIGHLFKGRLEELDLGIAKPNSEAFYVTKKVTPQF
ncbi:MAG: hypothetical protein WBN53_11670 [Thermodesulfobacteriota bacterium]|jgi:hypothetical protein